MIISNLIDAKFSGFDKSGLAIIEVGNGRQGTMSGQKILVAKKLLPKNIQAGDKLYFELMSEKMKTQRQKNLAEAVLREIIDQ
ncbi:hypothetical protein COZ61_00245 [Candidatus Berkelbacteria bacterium CG_4_8_14_3_um_filter_33_6]|uniref:DUF3006 domain-containing protein n=1 Tax=Candidatus Berkelbacteria bacterium CG_4_10_14_0_2_um_filter_35_9_33_12 TaxID=1974499 RepID=A0A2M7W4T4_9BACT|nr:MAG: hypothetical protein COX10_00070 [Candidatus Berkelbacteria bacterium CG23_combo_of_CG06-09_8_20_14_all_33_15]PIS08261.1 MAG: hypothetical protein COT76_02400 [Candidatus Berkelbacteria bacterium CG10_big_fil_rev_8_21_14_0_10_33_10]PIX31338.1 MAG: hypothetical protein COZ61_00245 [Candidatus Berkelbacteria bacterium CG_4_8_14_3_um_filter_33_6]PIZ28109.1 MAG: hypothetical protein COY43_02235 [Candidatus Berkelbacteria bacterium CG_4_10_14_0_8_um_filter_35_9_33_8]PJA20897.1 MAG: hypotheti